jgi:hypothetical protein
MCSFITIDPPLQSTCNRNDQALGELRTTHGEIQRYRTSNKVLLIEIEKLRIENAALRAQVEALLQAVRSSVQ